jgi:predicted nucleic acid-binding protein
MTQVVDASVVLAALIDAGSAGAWSRERLAADVSVAPHLLPVEVTSGLRRLALAGRVAQEVAALALQDLAGLDIPLYPFSPFAERVWAMRAGVTSYDAWYVALAEAHDAPLVTLDSALVGAAGPECVFLTP